MANRRMFAKSIIDTDYFLEMPATSQLLYFHLSIRADDDGFVASPKRILRMVGSSEDDFKLLIAKQFVIPFDSGVCVIKHWRIHNLIRADRYQPTIYTVEKSQLIDSENKSYELVHQNVIPDVIPTVNPVKVRLGKDSIGKDSICKDSVQMYDKCTPEKEIEIKKENTCGEVSSETISASPVFISLPKIGSPSQPNATHDVTEDDIKRYEDVYPGVDVRLELKKMDLWLDSNPANKKKNVKTFIARWLAKSQDRSRGDFNGKPVEKKHAGSREGYSVDISKYDTI